ncbi:MAG: MBG domain-containing protein [Lentihominibacter sp.]
MLNAGEYAIKASSSSNLYDVHFTDGTLTVNRKTLGIQWSDTRNLVYTGEPVNVTAEITGVLESDKCEVEVTGGKETGPSWDSDNPKNPTKYTATASISGGDSDNYRLPDSGSSIDYYIQRADPDRNDYAFPTEAVMTYGQKLSEATLAGASGEGEFVFVKADYGEIESVNDTIPDAGTYEYRIAYVPPNTEFERGVISEDPIKVTVSPKSVVAKADAKSKVYGAVTPPLKYTFNDTQLPECDKDNPDFDLGLTLTAGDGNAQYCDAGKYRIIKDKCENKNYDVTVIPAYLTVSKLVTDIKWPEQTEYTYTGDPVGITAKAANQAREDDCEIVVLWGDGKNAGSYKAFAVFLTNRNYVLAEDAKRTFEYTIAKATPEVTFPKSAEITYGQTLGQAKLEGEESDVPGEFILEEPDKLLTAADSGYEAEVRFVPDDSNNYNAVDRVDGKPVTVPVKVNEKQIDIDIDNQKKVYGQKTPEFTWHMDEAQLVGNDSISEFVIPLTAAEGDDQYCDVGGYVIAPVTDDIKQNENYSLSFRTGTLKVDPLLAEIRWNPVHNITVGGDGPSAVVTNLLNNDQCSVVVEYDPAAGEGGTEIPSRNDDGSFRAYTAKIAGLTGEDRFNYKLPDDDLEIQYYVRGEDSTDVIMPTKAVMTYGQKLSDAWMIGLSGPGTFTFENDEGEDIGDKVPASAGIYKCKVRFTPDEDAAGITGQTGDIEVTVRPKPITATALPGSKIYGEKTELEFELDESQLVPDDTKKDLKLTLTASDSSGKAGRSGDSINSPVGTYKIVLDECENSNYNVTVMPAWYTISPKMVSIKWSDVSDLVYTGKPVSVTAQAQDLMEGDKCDVKVVGGDRIQPGTYWAAAVSLTNGNYKLPKDYNQLVKEYTIQEAEDSDGGGSGPDSNGGSGTDKGRETLTSDQTNMFLMLLMLLTAILSASVAALVVRGKCREK